MIWNNIWCEPPVVIIYVYYIVFIVVSRSSCRNPLQYPYLILTLFLFVILDKTSSIVYIFRGKFHNKLDNVQDDGPNILLIKLFIDSDDWSLKTRRSPEITEFV